MDKRICPICGKEFTPKSSRRKMCYDKHFHLCPICDVLVETIDLQHLDSCCCKEHSRMLASRTIEERFPTPYQRDPKTIQKRKETCLERYGVSNPMFLDSVREKQQKNILSSMTDECIQKRRDTSMKKYGVDHPMKCKSVVENMQKSIQKKYHDPFMKSTFQLDSVKEKCDKINLEKFGTTIPMQNLEVWKKQATGKKSSIIASDGQLLDSTYELDVYEYCLRNKIPIKRTPTSISYEYNGKVHKTFIDFEIDGYLIEVKGEHILDGYFDWRGVPISAKLDLYKKNNVIVVTGSSHSFLFENAQGLRYQKDDSCLIGVDISLFKDPEFPYRDDRPKCFYDVKVNHQRSMFEAFQDELLRWKMIKNRIEYVGGFIDSKKILTAMNVTRTCKQPSWFSKDFAKRLIKNYITSDLIVDPFAGWGTRHDASIECHKSYIGIDMNKELVNWHKERNRSIEYGDASLFQFLGDCSVFICPPYQDVEVYFDNQDVKLTQCQWLDIVMKNIPNAHEYLMVCKVVDEGWEKYVVETKTNKSHFGSNHEYVLLIKKQ